MKVLRSRVGMRSCAVGIWAVVFSVAAIAAEDPPNFVVINIDDLGYADIGPFGSTINRTPHLDRMA